MMSVAIGEAHSCSIATTGEAYCWGNGSSGQLGTGNTRSQRYAVPVSSSIQFASITAGGQHACALTQDGTAYCWGANQHGQLGVADSLRVLQPRAVQTSIRFSALSAGWAHTCGLALAGSAYCWGRNAEGELGIGFASAAESAPIAVLTTVRFQQISGGGRHTCALTADGEAYCWGANELSQLGSGAAGAPHLVPVRADASVAFIDVSAGYNHTCAVDTDGFAYCWGENRHGELGIGGGSPTGSPGAFSPTRIVQFAGEVYTAVSAGQFYACGLRDSGHLMCWGRGANGQIGNGRMDDRIVRDLVRNEPGRVFSADVRGAFDAVDAGGSTHVCGLGFEGSVFCWGQGADGQLGSGEYFTMVPHRVLLSR